MKKLILYICLALAVPCQQLMAQVGYIYVHQSTVDEGSNPTTDGLGFKFNVSGGSTIVPQFILNDEPSSAFAANSAGTNSSDVGAATTGTLFAATPNGLYYRAVGNPAWINAAGASTSAIGRVDGGKYDMAVYSLSSGGLYFWTPALTVAGITIGSSNKTLISAGTTITDVAFDRVNDRILYVDGSNKIYWAKVSYTLTGAVVTGATVNSFTQVKNGGTSYTARRIDVDASGNLLYLGSGTDNNFYSVKNYNNTSNTGTNPISRTSLGQPNGASGTPFDIAGADDGGIYSACTTNSTFGVFKWTSGTTWVNEPQSGVTFNITGGPAGQVWSNYYSNNIWTREISAGVANWIDDERVRIPVSPVTNTHGNSQMIAVAPGTYTISQDPTVPANSSGVAQWNLQAVTVSDPVSGSGSTSSVSSSSATLVVAADEVVNVTFQNYFYQTTTLGVTCSSTPALFETFQTGTSGSLATIATGHLTGATSYHYYGTTKGSLTDGYCGVTTNSNDVGYGSNNGFTTVYDHTTGGVGSTPGNYLFVNASFQKDVFYQREFLNLVPGNLYTVSYWIANITGGISPNITAKLTDAATGNLLASSASGPIDTVSKWQSRHFSFIATQTAANLSLVNNTIGGNGNDLGIDDIKFTLSPSPSTTATVSNTCDGLSTITVTYPANPTTGTTTYYEYSDDNGANWQTSNVFTNVPQQTSYQILSRYKGSTTCNSSVTVQDVAAVYKWTGAAGTTSLTDAANWSTGIAPPLDGTTSIEIQVVNTGRKYPILTANASIYSLQIDGAPANINLGTYTLNVGCNIYNSTTGGLTTGTYPTGGILTGDLTNSTLNWNGTTATQRYVGNATAGTAKLGNMTVTNTYNNGAGVVTMGYGPIDIYNVLTLAEGNLTVTDKATAANTQLTLKSTQTQTAALAQIQSPGTGISVPVFTGTSVNVERYISGGTATSGYRGYRLLSSPVWTYNSAVSSSVNCYPISYVNTTVGSNPGALTGGAGTGNNPNSNGFTITNPFGNPTLYLYDESRTSIATNFVTGKNIGITNVTGSYVVITGNPTTTHTEIPVGNGYIFFFIGNNTNLSYLNTRTIEPTTITATGTVNQGDISVHLWNHISNTALSYTAGNGSSTIGAGTNNYGLNQVGNPYPSTISLDQVALDNPSIGTTFWELKEPVQNYVAYNSGGTTSSPYASPYIASGQGFLAQAWNPTAHSNTSSTLTFHESEKVNQQLVPSTTSATGNPALLLSVKHDGNILTGMHLQLTKDTLTATYTGIYFNATKGSDTFNAANDAVDLDGPTPTVYLSSYKTDGTRVSINEFGDYTKGKRVKLFVKATASATYQLSLHDISNVDTLYNVYLVDHLQRDSVDLRTTKSYSFDINTADTTTYGANRFELAISIKQLPPYKLLSFAGQKVSSGVQLAWKTQNESNYTGFTVEKLSGNQYSPLYDVQSSSASAYSFIDSHPVKGINTYRLKQDGVIGDVTYSQVVNINYNNLPAGESFIVYPNPAVSNISVALNLAPDTYTMNIYNAVGAKVKAQSVTGTYWTENVASYLPGMYVVELYDSKGKFIGKTKFVKTL